MKWDSVNEQKKAIEVKSLSFLWIYDLFKCVLKTLNTNENYKCSETCSNPETTFKWNEDPDSATAVVTQFPYLSYRKCLPKGIIQQHAWLPNERQKLCQVISPSLISLHGIIIHLMSWNNVIMKLAQPFFCRGIVIWKVLLKV